jgi:3beta-hydroxy-Delta5-steroid dehydrogenase / steroid Delta-isomerase
VERLYLDNYFSIAKAQGDLGYRPLFTTDRAMAECLPCYVDLFRLAAISARIRPLSVRQRAQITVMAAPRAG